jgi:hypothetical protein
VDESGRECERETPGCSRGSTGWGPSGVSRRKRDAVVRGEYRSERPDVHVYPDVRALAGPKKKKDDAKAGTDLPCRWAGAAAPGPQLSAGRPQRRLHF